MPRRLSRLQGFEHACEVSAANGWPVLLRETGGEPEHEPMYGDTYLPRKFKTGFVLPPSNDVDIYSQDLGYIAIVEDGKLRTDGNSRRSELVVEMG